jgi:hypothetical protein
MKALTVWQPWASLIILGARNAPGPSLDAALTLPTANTTGLGRSPTSRNLTAGSNTGQPPASRRNRCPQRTCAWPLAYAGTSSSAARSSRRLSSNQQTNSNFKPMNFAGAVMLVISSILSEK